MGKEGKSPKQDLTNCKDLTIELPEGRESSYHIKATRENGFSLIRFRVILTFRRSVQAFD